MSNKQINPEELKKLLQDKFGSNLRVDVMPQTKEVESDDESRQKKREKALEFDYKPSEIKRYLDRFVIKQDDAKKVLATAICDHYHHIQNTKDPEDWRDYKKQNIILIGPTGVGKTYLIQNIARLIGVPFVKADATKFSETGYVGGDVEDLVRELVSQSDNDLELAEKGIIYLDEIDKIASSTNTSGRDVSGHGVQRNLLKLMEETEVPLRSATDIASQMQAFMEFQTKGKLEKKTINTRNILFIVSGAFNGLSEIIKKRIGSKQIGFTGEKLTAEEEHTLYERVKAIDFIDYGFEAEFAGRLPVIVHCIPLEIDDLFAILKHSEGSILKQYKRDFLAYHIDTYFTDGGMREIAEKAALEHTGARGLMSVCEKIFREFKYRLPDSEVREFIVTKQLVQSPKELLNELLRKPNLYSRQIRHWRVGRFEKKVQKEYGFKLSFSPEAAEKISQWAEKENSEVVPYCEELFQQYEHALNLLSQNASGAEFVIDKDNVENLASAFEKWIKQSYAG